VIPVTQATTPYKVYGAWGFKNASLANRLLYAYPILVMLLRVKGSFELRARDTCRYLGICDHYTITCVGCLLSFLARLGLAKRLNGRRPVKYVVDPLVFSRYLWLCRIDRGEDYCSDKGCSGLGICPYWRIKQFLNGDRQ